MQDILTEVGLSAGAVYRYFPSKDDIVAAIAADALATIASAFEGTFAAAVPLPLNDVLDHVLTTVRELEASQGMGRIVIQAWGEALRAPLLAAQGEEIFARMRRTLIDFVRAYQRLGLLDDDVPPEAIARVLIAFLHGFLVQHVLLGGPDEAIFRDGLHALLRSGARANETANLRRD